METRKVQKTGGSSYIVSLPKAWCERMAIKEQDRVGIITRTDGTLLILPGTEPQRDAREKVIDVDEIDRGPLLFRMLVGAYIMGFNQVTLTSSGRMAPDTKATARRFINMAIGLEITEETPTSITVKDLLNPAEMTFTVWVERMSSLVASRLEDASRALAEQDAAAARDVIDRDIEVNRLHWILSRQHNLLARNIAYSERLGAGERRNANYSLISRTMERIGDYAVRIAENCLRVADKELDEKLMDSIAQAGKLAISIFKRSVDALQGGDIGDANKVIESVRELIKMCESIETRVLDQETAVGVAFGYINEAIRRTGESSADLCEYIINFLIDQSPAKGK
ncbi:MAG: phosphate uptake regulator PhoU [Candidatus Lokiarchaeota archaeon]|nr:phosphate uptake regulator PhoU [Candidatus Lokiarchaeota archaeon]